MLSLILFYLFYFTYIVYATDAYDKIKESVCYETNNYIYAQWRKSEPSLKLEHERMHVPYFLSMGNTHTYMSHMPGCSCIHHPWSDRRVSGSSGCDAHTRCSVCRKLNHHATSSPPWQLPSSDVCWCLYSNRENVEEMQVQLYFNTMLKTLSSHTLTH